MNPVRILIAFVIADIIGALAYQATLAASLLVHADIALLGVINLAARADLQTWGLLLAGAALPALILVALIAWRKFSLAVSMLIGVAIGLVIYATGWQMQWTPEYTVLKALNILVGNEMGMMPFVVPAGGFAAAAAWFALPAFNKKANDNVDPE